MKDAASAKQKHITKASKGTKGAEPAVVYTAMGNESMKFNTMTSEALLRQLPFLDVPKKAKAEFDKLIREDFPEWAGLDSDNAIKQVRGEIPIGKKKASKLRKKIATELSKDVWRKQGFPVYQDVINVLTEPDLLDIRRGDSGFTVFTGIPGANIGEGASHATYSHGIPGTYLGGFERSIPPEIMFPKQWAKTANQVNKVGNPLSRQERVGTVQMGHGYEMADQEWVDNVNAYLESQRRLNK